jgi:hypothetical protein
MIQIYEILMNYTTDSDIHIYIFIFHILVAPEGFEPSLIGP